MLHWLPGPEVALRWLDNSRPLEPSLWKTFSNVPLAISHYEQAENINSAPAWVEQFHPVAMMKHRTGNVRFPAWERSAEIVQDIRDLARLLEPSYLASYEMYTADTGQMQF